MLALYNALRALARGLAAGAVSVLLNGKAEPFGIKFEDGVALVLAATLMVGAWLAFIAESWAKRRAGV